MFSNPDCFTMASGADAVDWNSIKSLVFGGGVKQLDRDELFGEGKASSTVAKVTQGDAMKSLTVN